MTEETNFLARPLIGWASGIAIMLIWSGWLVASRAGVTSALTVHDIMAFRFGIASLIALPVCLYVKPWRGMSLVQIVTVTLVLGIPYTYILFGAFNYAPAAHAAIFMNGVLPALTAILAFLIFREIPNQWEWLGGFLILIGAGFAAFGSVGFRFADTWFGDVLFVLAGLFFCIYMTLNRIWHLSMTQIWLCGSVINAIIFLPVWYLFLPSGIGETSETQLWIQMIYQGIVPNIIGLVLVAITVRHIGPALSAALMSGVPAMGSFLGFIFLGESLTVYGLLSIAILTPGILIVSLGKQASAKP